MNVRLGKAWRDAALWDRGPKTGEKSGWFVGPHAGIPDGLRRTEHFEVKWYEHPAGQAETGKGLSGAVTISVLVCGKFEIRFREGDGDEWEAYTLDEPGDYLIWGPGLHHEWKALDNSTVLTVRPATGKIFNQNA